MDKQEKIVCAAINDSDSSINFEYITLYVQYPIGIKAYEKGTKKRTLGFITSKNRFVDAKEAMRIAVEENQIEAIRKAFDAIPNFHDKGIDSHEFGEAANAAIDIRDEYLARELKPEDLY